MDLWEQAKFNKAESPNQKQILEQPQIAKQQDIATTPQKETKEAAPKNSQSKIFKSPLHSKRESSTKRRSSRKIILQTEQNPTLVIVPNDQLAAKKDETRVIGAEATAANSDSSEMPELVKLLVKLTDDKLKQKQNLQAGKNFEQKATDSPRRNIIQKEQKEGLMMIPFAEMESVKYDSKIGVSEKTESVSSHSDASEMTPLVKLLVKLTDEHKKHKSLNVNVRKSLLSNETAGAEIATNKKDMSRDRQSQSSPISSSSCSKNISETRESPENDTISKKKADLKQKFYAGVEDSNLRKQFDFLMDQEDLNEIIDQMMIDFDQ